MPSDSFGRKEVVYTAIPKFLVYANLEIGAYVENQGFAVTTPWQYTYGMGGTVDYDQLVESINTLAITADRVWVFGAPEGTFPDYEDDVRYGIGLTDGVVREVELAHDNGLPVGFHEIDPESMEIEGVGHDSGSAEAPPGGEQRAE